MALTGVESLLQAAYYLEQQERLNSSPQSVATPTPTTLPSFYARGPFETNNDGGLVYSRQLKNHHVSSSAPAAGATFHHATTNGLIATSTSGGKSQLINNNHNHHQQQQQNISNDFNEFNNVGGGGSFLGGLATVVQAAAAIGGKDGGRMSEDAFPSTPSLSSLCTTTTTTTTTTNTNTTIPPSEQNFSKLNNTSQNSFQLQPNAMAILLPTEAMETEDDNNAQMHAVSNQQKMHHQQQQHLQQKPHTPQSESMIVDGCNEAENLKAEGGIAAVSAVGVDGVGNIAVNGNSIAGQQQLRTEQLQQQQQQKPLQFVSIKPRVIASTLPTHYNNNNCFLPMPLLHPTARPKSSVPLTPPPMSSRKYANEPQTRIRSYSLNHKFSANHLVLHNGGSGSSPMIVDDAHMTYAGSNSNHSPPPRHHVAGNHYMQLTSSSSSSQGSQVAHVTPALGGSGRRRTISSNSNGAGTREVHNKLEKNRRAHLKECYEQLKNELPLKDEDRKKISNLAILEKAYDHVVTLNKEDQKLEAQMEDLAKDKIILQKRVVNLKRDLGSKYEQFFSNIFPDMEPGSERGDTLNDSVSLSSGRGSTLYSSSSSLSSGGSNAMSSPVGAGLQTATPTAISPVICNTNTNNNNTINTSATTVSIATTSPVSPNNNNNNNNNNTTTHSMLQHLKSASSLAPNSPTGHSAVTVVGSANMPLSLTAKNISATSLTRGSPTPSPSTPSPSPSSSSGVSSSSSLISSSPPMNGVINSHKLTTTTINIPNGLKFQAANGGNGIGIGVGVVGGIVNGLNGVNGTIGNGTTTATIIAAATAANSNITNVVSGSLANSNNARVQPSNSNSPNKPVVSMSAVITPVATTAPTTVINAMPSNGYRRQTRSRKTSLTTLAAETEAIAKNIGKNSSSSKNNENDGEQPTKFIKVYNGITTAEPPALQQLSSSSSGSGGNNNIGCNRGNLNGIIVSPSTYFNQVATSVASQPPKLLTTTNGSENSTAPTLALYQSNGKLVLLNGDGNNTVCIPTTLGDNGGNLGKDKITTITPVIVSSQATATTIATNSGTLQYVSSLPHLIAATTDKKSMSSITEKSFNWRSAAGNAK